MHKTMKYMMQSGCGYTVYGIAKSINSAQALDALESLAGQLGQEGGLEFWEGLAQQEGEITTPSRKKGTLPIYN